MNLSMLRKLEKIEVSLKKKNEKPLKNVYSSAIDFANKVRQITYNGEYAYLKRIQEETSPKVTICKGSQLGFSEAMVNVSCHRLYDGKSVLYALPTDGDVTDFSSARFNPVFENLGEKKIDNVGLKMIGRSCLYLRGARSRSKLKSIPVALLILDEYDEMEESKIELARERTSGQKEKQEFDLSTPSLPDVGIFKQYKSCDQYFFMFPCPHCLRKISLAQSLEDVAKHLKNNTYECLECQKPFSHEQKLLQIPKGEWVLVKKGNGDPGYHLSQLYSPTVTFAEISKKIQEAEGDEIKLQELHNSKLGLPYEAKGSRLSLELFDSKITNFNTDRRTKVCGIDISGGNGLHYCVLAAVTEYGLVVEKAFRCSWNDLGKIEASCFVLDANPERKAVTDFVETKNGNAYMALYPNKVTVDIEVDEEKNIAKLHRTASIDTIFAMFKNDRIRIKPHAEIEKLKEHCHNEVRCYRQTKSGTYEAYYTEVGDDHYLHALVYAYAASQLWSGENVGITKERFI